MNCSLRAILFGALLVPLTITAATDNDIDKSACTFKGKSSTAKSRSSRHFQM